MNVLRSEYSMLQWFIHKAMNMMKAYRVRKQILTPDRNLEET